MPRAAAILFTICAVWMSPTVARAADDVPRVWYGWQTLSVDLASAAVIAHGAFEDEPNVFWPGGVAFVLGTPLLHIANGRAEIAPVSLALRAGTPLLFGVAGVLLAEAGEGRDETDRLVLVRAAPGLIIGGLLAMLVDAKLLAHRPVRQERLGAALSVGPSSAQLLVHGLF